MAYIYLNVTNINKLLQNISGATQISGIYWSSSECSSIYAWRVYFTKGSMDRRFRKNNKYNVRFCRYITE